MKVGNEGIEVLDAGIEEDLANANTCCSASTAPLKKPTKSASIH